MANNMQNTGKSLNEQIWGEGGTGQDGYKAQLEKEIANQAQTGTASNGYSNQDLQNAINQANQNGANITGSTDSYSQDGRYVNNGGNGVLPGTGEEGWTYVEGERRPTVAGTSGADEDKLSDAAYQYVQYCKQMYAAAKSPEEKAYWHNEAEKTRAAYGYSAGTDGSMYIPIGQLGVEDESGNQNIGGYGGSAGGGNSAGGGGSQSDLKGLLDAWQDAAINQQNGQIDYAVAKAVADLERALADAQPQFKEQAESVDRSARQAMDNAALYAEMRGDKGGIGQEQYNSIQNTQAQNHLTVQQAQTKLATDTQRQIADLRAQGEFEKADAALQITQQYLQQLIGLEQWAAEYNLSVDQFNESVRQWEAEYNMAMQQLQISQNQWQAEYDFKQKQYADSLSQYEQSQISGMGQALLNAGIMPDDKQLAAMGISKEQAQQFITAAQMEAQLKGGNTGNTKIGISDIDLGAAYQYLYDNNLTNRSSTDAIVAMLGIQNIPPDVAKQVAALYVDNGYAGLKNAGSSNGTTVNQSTYDAGEALWDRGSNAPTQVTVPDSKPFYQSADRLNLPVYGYDLPPLIELLRQYGAIEEGADGYLRWKNGWNASNYSARLSQIAGEAIWDRHS